VRTSVEVYRMGAGPAGSETVLERAAQRAILATRVDSWQESGVEGDGRGENQESREREQSVSE
jgi:hypothetical protein